MLGGFKLGPTTEQVQGRKLAEHEVFGVFSKLLPPRFLRASVLPIDR